MTPGRDVLKDSLAAYLLVIYSGLAMVETYLQGSPTFLVRLYGAVFTV